MNKLIRLLHEVDGQLGLAVYRNEHDERWKDEAKELITRIRRTINELASPEAGGVATEAAGRTTGGGDNENHYQKELP